MQALRRGCSSRGACGGPLRGPGGLRSGAAPAAAARPRAQLRVACGPGVFQHTIRQQCSAGAAAGLACGGSGLLQQRPHQLQQQRQPLGLGVGALQQQQQQQQQQHPQQQRRHCPSHQQQQHGRRSVATAAIAGTLTATGIIPLGYDFLTFLSATVLVVPACKYLKLSPVLGFLAAGVLLEQAGMLKDLKDMETLSELGVLFLLYEQGLELSLDRLKALAKYAFGMGSLQVIITTLIFTVVALPAGSGLGTWFLEKVCHAEPALVSIRSVDEAVVIAAALSMSSSAFVLQLLGERGESATRTGSATLGILLFQDIAVVPFLVLLPLIESSGGMEGASADTLLQMLGPTTATSLAGLGALLIGGRVVLRRIFEIVANSRSSEAFVAACLLTVGASSLLTKQLGLSDTLGAFVAGVLLSETSFRTQVEADIRPFRGLLIGLFFLSVGGSINMEVLRDNWDIIAWMLAGLVSLKAGVNIMLGPLFGLTRSESIRTGFILSQGGEFAFVLLSLACQLKLLPEELNQILIITVVASMALTPTLADFGSKLADFVDAATEGGATSEDDAGRAAPPLTVDDPIVILGFGPQGQMVANMLSSPLAGASAQSAYLGFDLDPAVVNASQQAGFRVSYGDGARPDVLKAAGVKRPAAIVVCRPAADATTKAVSSLRAAFSTVPIYACAQSFKHAAELRDAGADNVCVVSSEAGLNLGTQLLTDLGTPDTAISLLRRGIHEALAVRSAAALQHTSEASSSSGGSGGSSASLASLSSLSSLSSIADADGALQGLSSSSGGARAQRTAGSPPGSPVNGASSNGEGGEGKKKKKRPDLEVFVLDGRYAYGVQAPPRPPSAEPIDAPCAECPLVRSGLDALEAADSAAATAPAGSNGSHSAVGAVAAAASAEQPAASPSSSGINL